MYEQLRCGVGEGRLRRNLVGIRTRQFSVLCSEVSRNAALRAFLVEGVAYEHNVNKGCQILLHARINHCGIGEYLALPSAFAELVDGGDETLTETGDEDSLGTHLQQLGDLRTQV